MRDTERVRRYVRTRLPASCPKAHQIDRTVRSHWCEAGMNSATRCQYVWGMHKRMMGSAPKNTAESTGGFPPTPTLSTAKSEHNAMSFGEAPAAVANTPVMKSVRLKHHLCVGGDKQLLHVRPRIMFEFAHFRPQTSQPTPQNAAPTSRPMFCASLRNGPWKLNSFTTGVKMRPDTIYVRLEYAAPL